MKTYLFFLLAGCFNCVMDILMFHYSNSVFKNLRKEWWNPNYSWMNVKPFLGWMRLDAWHLFKFGMLFCLAFGATHYIPFLGFWWDFLICTIMWGVGFESLWRVLK